jgi:hypothetical protein
VVDTLIPASLAEPVRPDPKNKEQLRPWLGWQSARGPEFKSLRSSCSRPPEQQGLRGGARCSASVVFCSLRRARETRASLGPDVRGGWVHVATAGR